MLYFRTVGTVPRKRHTQFRQASGELYYEEMIGEEGFSSTFSLLYHRGVPAAFSGSDDWPLPDQALTPMYRNAIGDECLYIESGRAVLESVFGAVDAVEADFVCTPSTGGRDSGGIAGSVVHAARHPFDVDGWAGCLYPFRFNVADFEPVVGRIHQPPPVHQVFEGQNFVMCAFVPGAA